MNGKPAATELAELLLEHEAPGISTPTECAAAAERVTRRLHTQLARLVGDTGCDLLMRRALSQAAAEHSMLDGVRWNSGSEAGLEGLHERFRDRQHEADARAACRAVIAAFLSLLVSFIGHDLTVRQVQRAWPDLPPNSSGEAGDSGPRRKEAH